MGRSTGFWWSPDSRRIAFLRIDESAIEPTLRFEIEADQITMIEQRYPFTGTPNVTYRLGVIDLENEITDWIDLGEETDIYIPRLDWLPDGQSLSFQRQSRDQKRLELVIARLDGKAITQRAPNSSADPASTAPIQVASRAIFCWRWFKSESRAPSSRLPCSATCRMMLRLRSGTSKGSTARPCGSELASSVSKAAATEPTMDWTSAAASLALPSPSPSWSRRLCSASASIL